MATNGDACCAQVSPAHEAARPSLQRFSTAVAGVAVLGAGVSAAGAHVVWAGGARGCWANCRGELYIYIPLLDSFGARTWPASKGFLGLTGVTRLEVIPGQALKVRTA